MNDHATLENKVNFQSVDETVKLLTPLCYMSKIDINLHTEVFRSVILWYNIAQILIQQTLSTTDFNPSQIDKYSKCPPKIPSFGLPIQDHVVEANIKLEEVAPVSFSGYSSPASCTNQI